jgi:hypothetical protein
MISWKLPEASSSRVDVDSLCRSIDFGVITTSGLRTLRTICRRSMWNICAGVVGVHTCMLFAAQSCRKRSRRADECSGPWPS